MRSSPALLLRAPLALAALLSAVVLLLLARPTGGGGQSVIGGGGGDFPSIAWGLWRVAAALPGLPALQTDLLFFPQGARLLIADLPGALAVAPVTLLLGPVVAFNVLQAAHVVLAAVAGTALAREVAPEAGVAGWLIAGLSLGLSPTLLSSLHNGNPDVTPIFVVPLAALCVRRLADPAAGWGFVAGAALCVGLSPWLNPYVGVMAALAALVAAPWRSGRVWLAGGIAVLLAGGYAAVTLHSLAGADPMIAKPTLLAGVPSPGAAHLRGFLWPDVGTQADGWSRHLWQPGVSILLLAALGLLRQRGGWRWLLLAGLGGLLSLGPVVQLSAGVPLEIGGFRLDLPLASLPVVASLQIQYRFAALASAGLGVLAASGAARLGRWGGGAALLVVLLELSWWGAPLVAAGPAPSQTVCDLLAPLPAGPVLDLPGEREELRLLAQTCHGRPVAEGINQPYPHRVRQVLDDTAAEPFAALAGLGFRHLILHDETGPLTPPGERVRARRLAAQARAQGRIVAEAEGIVIVDLGAL